MARGHKDLPKNVARTVLQKREIFNILKAIDNDSGSRSRILAMENDFRQRINSHISSLPDSSSKFQKFNTSPFVLMFYSKQQNYSHVYQIEKDIVPAKVFSSMETSAGRMVEAVVLPIYGWETVQSTMHSTESVLDGRKETSNGVFMAATLKSGPRCLNDEMAKDIGVDVVKHTQAWAKSHKSSKVEFTYGVLYGTKRQSNKKDWHILRNIGEALPSGAKLKIPCRERWNIGYSDNNVDIEATVRVGIEWWDYLGGPNTWVELCVALIRVCINPSLPQRNGKTYVISDLQSILDLSVLPNGYNVSVLQQSQLEWLPFLARHFCDDLQD